MINLPKVVLDNSCDLHVLNIAETIFKKIEILNLCIKYYPLQSKSKQIEFTDKLKKIKVKEPLIVQSVNWFLEASTYAKNGVNGEFRNIKSINKVENFFKQKNRRVENTFTTLNALKRRLDYFSKTRILNILKGLPIELITEDSKYKYYFPSINHKHTNREVLRLLTFIFDYDEFSDKDSVFAPEWGAYKLTESLGVRSCLYCNRNYILTVFDGNGKIIRAELDHFFFKKEHPILALSFYNLIPSCHICNSNLKHSKVFSFQNSLHPYISSYEDNKISFTYRPYNARAFFNDKSNLDIKLYHHRYLPFPRKIKNSIDVFQIEKIYNHHIDVVDSLLDLQRKTSKNWIKDIYENVLKDSNGKHYTESEKEVYELAIRNYYSPNDFHKKPLAKFERDIAKEIGLIKKNT